MKPSCCFPIRFAVKGVAILDFIGASFGVVITSGALIYLHLFPTEVNNWFREGLEGGQIHEQLQIFINFKTLWMEDSGLLATSLLITGLIYALQKLVLACVLIIAVFQERVKLLRIWVVYSLIVLVISVVGYLGLLMAGVTEPWSIPFFVATFIVREYVIWITTTFLKRVQATQSDDSFLIHGRSSNKVVYKL